MYTWHELQEEACTSAVTIIAGISKDSLDRVSKVSGTEDVPDALVAFFCYGRLPGCSP